MEYIGPHSTHAYAGRAGADIVFSSHIFGLMYTTGELKIRGTELQTDSSQI